MVSFLEALYKNSGFVISMGISVGMIGHSASSGYLPGIYLGFFIICINFLWGDLTGAIERGGKNA